MVDIQHSGTTLVTALLVPGILTLALFILRTWFRITRWKYDTSDTLLTGAVLCGIIQGVIWLVLVFPFHHGKFKADIPPSILASKWPPKLLYLNQIVFKLTTPLCKLSLCFLYRTICATSTGRLIDRTRISIWCTVILIVNVYVSALFVSIFQCTPIRKIWVPKTSGHCIDVTQFRYSTAVFNIVTSLAVITLPIPVLLKLKHHRPEIKQLIGLVLLGLIHTSLTIARFAVMFFPDPLIKTEPQYGWVPAQTLAVCEMEANILFATLVVMRPAFQAVYHALPSRRSISNKLTYISTSDSVLDTALGRFRDAWERKNRKWASDTYILETMVSSKTSSAVNVEDGDQVSSNITVQTVEYTREGHLC